MSYLSRRNSVHELASRLTKKSLKATICGVRGHKGASGIATNIYYRRLAAEGVQDDESHCDN